MGGGGRGWVGHGRKWVVDFKIIMDVTGSL